MYIKSAKFIKSSKNISDCPLANKLEFAFIGRSNVGKSSLINMLTNKKKLALTSSTPGKTKLINHFLIDDKWYLVDLPGYGYIKASKNLRHQFSEMIKTYLLNRMNLCCTFVLIDIRHKPQKNDLDFMNWLGVNKIPFMIVFTKTDKISNKIFMKLINHYEKEMLITWEKMPNYFITSSIKKRGKEEILNQISSIIKNTKIA